MKKLITIIIIVILITLMMPSLASCTPRENILKIRNWEDYIEPEVIEEFKDYYFQITGEKIKVEYEASESNEEMLSLIAVGQADLDLICPSDYMIEKMINEKLLLKIDTDLGNDINGNPITNYMGLASSFTKGREFDPNNEYSVGYMWGTLGILYNTTLVDKEITSWADMWDATYNTKILMKNSVRDSYAIASIYANRNYLNQSRTTTTPEEYNFILTNIINNTSAEGINLTKTALLAQKPYLKGYEVDSGKQDMIDGTAIMSLQWAGDAVYSISENEDLAYVIPEEGSNIFFDGWVIPKYAGNKKAAQLFINFISKPEIAIANMDYIGYTSVVASSEIIDYLNENYSEYPAIDLSYFFGEAGASVHADPNMFPSADTVTRLAVMRDFGTSDTAVASMWNMVKSG